MRKGFAFFAALAALVTTVAAGAGVQAQPAGTVPVHPEAPILRTARPGVTGRGLIQVPTVGTVPKAAVVKPEPPKGAENASLGLFTKKERAQLLPFLDRGPVALVEFSDEDRLPAILFAAKVHAAADDVARIIAEPADYPRFMPALDSIDVRSRYETMIAYDWTWKTSLFTLTGQSIMNVFPPPATRPDRGFRISTRSTGGDLGVGRMMWRVYPLDEHTCLVVQSSRIDLRNANWVTKQIASAEQSVNRTANIALGFAMLRGVTRRAEGTRASKSASARPPALVDPKVKPKTFATTLNRGDLVFLQMDGDRLDQVSVVSRMFRRFEKIHRVMADPTAFGGALIPGSYVKAHKKDPATGIVDFDWGVNLPLVGSKGTMRLTDHGDTVDIVATKGTVRGGEWHFKPVRLPWREGAMVSWGNFDPARASWLIAMLAAGNQDFGHGIVIGAELMVNRAIRAELHQ